MNKYNPNEITNERVVNGLRAMVLERFSDGIRNLEGIVSVETVGRDIVVTLDNGQTLTYSVMVDLGK